MDYFSKFLRSSNPPPPPVQTDRFAEFLPAWKTIKDTLEYPDERQLSRGIQFTDVPNNLKVFVDILVWESNKTEEGGTGACLEYLLKHDVLGTLVRLSETDRPSGIQAEVLRAVQNLVVLMDEHFLVHSAVHKAVLRLLRNCAGDDLQDQLDGRKVMGAAGSVVHRPISEYEEDLVNLLCILCSRIRTFRELLMIFFHDKHWHQSEPLFSVEEEDEEEEDESSSNDSASTVNAATGNAEIPPTTGTALDKRVEYEFLLFNYLLRFVHREGPTGDFARAGCLFLMDVAMSTGKPEDLPQEATETTTADPIRDAELALAEYILNGDFPEVLAAGLGAVYSLLPSKLGFRPEPQPFGTNIEEPNGRKKEEEVVETEVQPPGAEDGLSENCRGMIDHFLKMLEFLQDVLRRSSPVDSQEQSETLGNAIGRTILDAVRRSFLENVLYPSILECTDADGSAVAVMSYIEITIRTLKKGPLSDLILQYLLSEDNADIPSKQRQTSVVELVDAPPSASSNRSAKHRRRKSSAMVLLEMEAPDARKQTEYLTALGRYTLRDLLLANLQSSSAITAVTALHLLRTLIVKHPQLASERLIIGFRDTITSSWSDHRATTALGDSDQRQQPETTYSTHEREMGLYFTLITRVDPSHSGDAFSTGYNRYLCDALSSIQSQLVTHQDISATAKHRLSLSDPVLTLLLDSLRHFFINTAEFNVALTGVLSTLASDPERSLQGWLTFASSDEDRELDPLTEKDPIELILDDNHSVDGEINDLLAKDLITLPAASMNEKSRPLIQTIFQTLVNQLEHYRASIDKFDAYLQQRRQGLLFSENMTDALISMDIMEGFSPSKPVTEPAAPPPKPKTSSSFVSYFTPKRSKAAPPSTATPETQSPKRGTNTQEVASPFGRHYQDTKAIIVDPDMVSEPAPTKVHTASDSWNTDGDVFNPASSWDTGEETTEVMSPPKPAEVRSVTLSELLDNVVILEESIKEFAAIIHARRSLGIDSVRYI